MQHKDIHDLPGDLLLEILTHLPTDDVIPFLTTSNELLARTVNSARFLMHWNNYWFNSINLHFNNVGKSQA